MAEQKSEGKSDRHPEGRLRDEILRRLQRIEGGAWANRMAPAGQFSAHDRRRITEYVAGITRQLRWLDFVVDSFSRRSDIDMLVRQVLRIGVYELAALRRAPHAAVYASVEQAKRLASRGAGKFVNGVLRNLLRNIEALPRPETGDEVKDTAILCSHPDWMVRRWVDRFGMRDACRLMEYDNRRPAHSIRVNTLKISVHAFCDMLDRRGVAWQPSPYMASFLRVEKLQAVIAAGVFEEGLAAVQDESAGLVGVVLAPHPGEYVIDACAAPGGKMIHAAILMENRGRIVGVDTNENRLSRGLSSARAHGLSIVEIRTGDFRTMSSSPRLEPADAVLIDAPCSGLGVLSRRPDLRWRRNEESIAELVDLQDQLLDAAVRFVKPGGRLVYATCTIEPEENEQRIEAFLSRHSDFTLEPLSRDQIDASLIRNGYLVTLPHVHGIDGAFAARLVRRRPVGYR